MTSQTSQPTDSFERQYDEVVTYYKQYQGLRKEVADTVTGPLWRAFTLGGSRNTSRVLGSDRQYDPLSLKFDPLSTRTPDSFKELVEEFATEAQKESPFYEAVVSDYPVEVLSTKLDADKPGLNYESLEAIHEMRRKRVHFDYLAIFGFIIGASALFLQAVPSAVVEKLGGNYDIFTIVVFCVLIVTILYALVIFFPLWFTLRRAEVVHEGVGQLLRYSSLRQR